jgi:hypothetical protein
VSRTNRIDNIRIEEADDDDADLLNRGVDALAPRGWGQKYSELEYDKPIRFTVADKKEAQYVRTQIRMHAKKKSETCVVIVAENPWRVIVKRENPYPEPSSKLPPVVEAPKDDIPPVDETEGVINRCGEIGCHGTMIHRPGDVVGLLICDGCNRATQNGVEVRRSGLRNRPR